MKRALVEKLADPLTMIPLSVEAADVSGQDVISGKLRSSEGGEYPVIRGIPRFVMTKDDGQTQTGEAFGFKWKKRDTYDSPASKRNAAEWYIDKYGFASLDEWARYFNSRRAIADIGCGSGFSSSLWLESPEWTGRAMWVGADISEAIDVAQERLSSIPNTHFVQADALQLPFPDGSFDTLFSEGVLHHTPSTRSALLSAARILCPGGEASFYVYKKKAPIREFTDDYVRDAIAGLSDEEAWNAMRAVTQLGRVLSEMNATIDLPVDVPVLEIKAGSYDVQRLIYWKFAKLYWNSALSFEENVHINFDWYRPTYAHRQTEDQVRTWCAEANLEITRLHDSEAGYTVRAVRR